LEPQFYSELLDRLGLARDQAFAAQMNRDAWPELSQRLAQVFRTKSQAEWCAELEHTDVCFAPVLTLSAAAEHPHNRARRTFVEANGKLQPAPAPRFSRTPAAIGTAPAHPGEHSREVLAEWGVPASRIEELVARGAVVDR
jgi:alpha-methylacyl-CoA racemase